MDAMNDTDEDEKDDELVRGTALAIVEAIEGKSKDQKVLVVANSIAVIANGFRAQVLSVVDDAIAEMIGPLYAGAGNLKARVTALEEIAKCATVASIGLTSDELGGTGAITISHERWGAILRLREAVTKLEDAKPEATKTG
jgi:hypothetical protein